MGKVNIEIEAFVNGINFIVLQQIITSIPGKSYTKHINERPNPGIVSNSPTEYVVTIENSNFADGTIVKPKYRLITITDSQGVSTFDAIFDGIEITDPPAAQLNQHSAGQNTGAINGNMISPVTIYTTGGSGNYTIPSMNYAITLPNTGKSIKFTDSPDPDKASKPQKCICDFNELMKNGCQCGGT